ncbi:hypothetical protein SLEP1_g9259 [Rubroshorea leprosula]|uniref:Uncharacterized protein n=1 Tax=Rubroshorea leprosula TaxID=152421 RepID=A0AAV5ICS2_9ROSI|nr:hypothetical protein SLEP1_g9259 [Rubroshorea leprosula]
MWINERLDQVVSGLFQFKRGFEFESLCMQQPPLGDSTTIFRCVTRVESELVEEASGGHPDVESRRGGKSVEKTEVYSHNIDTIRYVEKKMEKEGVQRLDRHPTNRIGPGRSLPKAAPPVPVPVPVPANMVDNELDPVPTSVDEGDPNYVDEEVEDGNVDGIVVAKAVAKMAGDIGG